jgi:hypothetical protein
LRTNKAGSGLVLLMQPGFLCVENRPDPRKEQLWIDARMDDFLSKPIRASQLASSIDRWLS